MMFEKSKQGMVTLNDISERNFLDIWFTSPCFAQRPPAKAIAKSSATASNELTNKLRKAATMAQVTSRI